MWTLRIGDRLSDPVELWRAWIAFREGKRRRQDVAAFSAQADRHVLALARDLAAGTWHPDPYHLIRVTDPKRRLIAAATVRDRVLHHAWYRLIGRRFEQGFVEHSYACLPGRGAHRALLAFQARLNRHRFVMQLDVRRYFYSIDREILRDLVARHLPEPPVQLLLDRLLASGAGLYSRPSVAAWLDWDRPQPPHLGLPIGNLTSQHWGNLYLNGIDHHAQRTLRVPAWQRYMDDMALFADEEATLLRARDAVAAWLAQHRGLSLKDPDAPVVRTAAPQAYLGYRVTHDTFEPGPKARGRLHANVGRAMGSPKRLAAVTSAWMALWRFGA